MGAVRSAAEAVARDEDKHTGREFDEESVEESVCARRATRPDRQAALRDIQAQLFKRLREEANEKMLRVIDAWEPVSLEDDHIPILNGDRKTTWKVRQLARKVMAELGETPPGT
ncbi:MAG: hypothetical protein ACLQM8_09005 [Limisphaerales bacterium]